MQEYAFRPSNQMGAAGRLMTSLVCFALTGLLIFIFFNPDVLKLTVKSKRTPANPTVELVMAGVFAMLGCVFALGGEYSARVYLGQGQLRRLDNKGRQITLNLDQITKAEVEPSDSTRHWLRLTLVDGDTTNLFDYPARQEDLLPMQAAIEAALRRR